MVCGDQNEELTTLHYWQISRLCGEQTANQPQSQLGGLFHWALALPAISR